MGRRIPPRSDREKNETPIPPRRNRRPLDTVLATFMMTAALNSKAMTP